MNRRVRVAAAAVLGILGSAACSSGQGPESSEVIDRGVFIATYVDLRMSTLRQGVDQIPTVDRDRILAEHGVSEQDLLDFVEIRGHQPEFMQPVWDTIEARIDRERLGTGAIQGPDPDAQPPDSAGT